MKVGFFLVLSFLVSGVSFAGDLNLSGGETAIIEANTTTRVSCGGGAGGVNDCLGPVEGLKALLNSCQKTYGGGYCADRYWPDFKKNNPNCYYAGLPACLEACEKNYGGGYCADRCR